MPIQREREREREREITGLLAGRRKTNPSMSFLWNGLPIGGRPSVWHYVLHCLMTTHLSCFLLPFNIRLYVCPSTSSQRESEITVISFHGYRGQTTEPHKNFGQRVARIRVRSGMKAGNSRLRVKRAIYVHIRTKRSIRVKQNRKNKGSFLCACLAGSL